MLLLHVEANNYVTCRLSTSVNFSPGAVEHPNVPAARIFDTLLDHSNQSQSKTKGLVSPIKLILTQSSLDYTQVNSLFFQSRTLNLSYKAAKPESLIEIGHNLSKKK